jgi:ribosomal protein S18 acetylase RimI-like enzyme
VLPILIENGAIFKRIEVRKQLVGYLMVIDGYIDGLFVSPGYRRQGLGKKAVMEYIQEYGLPERLHIVNTNKVAKKFWHSIFKMRMLEKNEIDTLWEIEGLK